MTPLKVLLVSPIPPPNGGIQTWSLLLIAWLENRPNILLRHVNTSPRWRGTADLNIPKRLVGGSIQGLWEVYNLLVGLLVFRPDVMHLTTSANLAGIRDIVFLSLARLFAVPSVYHIHIGRIPELVKGKGWEWRLLHRAFCLTRKVIVINQASHTALKRLLPAEKLLLLPNAISLKPARCGQANGLDGTRRVLFLSWVTRSKGIGELMEAWNTVAQAEWELVVAGSGDTGYRQELVQLAGCNTRVRFLGEVPHSEGWKLMQQADILVLPSYTEGFPNVILEAMAAGTAIVASRVGAIPQMLDDGTARSCGLLVEPKDSPGLAEALRRLMDDASLRAELGQRGREKVRSHYEADVVFGELLTIWGGLQQQGAPVPPETSIFEGRPPPL